MNYSVDEFAMRAFVKCYLSLDSIFHSASSVDILMVIIF